MAHFAATVATKHILLSSDEQVLKQTVTVEVDTGSQRTYITNKLEEKLSSCQS